MHYNAATTPGSTLGLGSLPRMNSVPDNNQFVVGFMGAYGPLWNAADDHPFTRGFYNYARTIRSGPNYIALVHRGISPTVAGQLMLAVYLNNSPYIMATLARANDQPDPRCPGAQMDSYVMSQMLNALDEVVRNIIR